MTATTLETAAVETAAPPLSRRLTAEALGTGLLVTVVIGSGIAAESLSKDVGVQLLANSFATVGGLAILILLLSPISSHFNPVVTVVEWFLERRGGGGMPVSQVAAYIGAQIVGGTLGAVLANAMYAEPLVSLSEKSRGESHLWIAEVVATFGLVLLIFGLARTARAAHTPWAVAAYIGAAYWFTSSTSFANPAVTVARMFSDTFAGITPSSVPAFVIAQVIGAALAVGAVLTLFPLTRTDPRERLTP